MSDPDGEVVVLVDDDEYAGNGATDGQSGEPSALSSGRARGSGIKQLAVVVELDTGASQEADPDVRVSDESPPTAKRARLVGEPDVLVLSSEEVQRIQPSLKAQNRQLQRELERMKRLHEELSTPVPAYWQTKQEAPGAALGLYRSFDLDLDSPEAEKVLALWQQGGIPRDRVRGVERIENHDLWRKYCQRKTEVARERPQRGTGQLQAVLGRDSTELCAIADERYLFHGAAANVLDTIVKTGFDVRVSNLTGALGAGVYFAEKARYSDDYSARAPHDHETQYSRAGGGYPGGRFNPPPPPPQPSRGRKGKGKHTSAAQYAQAQLVYKQQLGSWLRENPAMAAVYPHLVAQAGAYYDPPREVGRYMLLCRVVVGTCGKGTAHQRRPDPGTHSAYGPAPCNVPGYMICTFDNAQAYPEYRIHYDGIAPTQRY